MALKLTASSSEYLEISSSLPDHNADGTICLWVRAVDASVNQNLWLTGVDATNVDDLYINAGKVGVYITGGGGTTSVAGSITVSSTTWTHVAFVRSGTSNIYTYIDGVLDISTTHDPTGRGATSLMRLGTWIGAPGDSYDGRVWGSKRWTRALSQAEIRAEMRQAMPVSKASLYGVWPFLAGATRAKDFSGKGHDWTEGNSPTDEDPPNVRFRGPEPLIWEPVAAAGGNTCTPTTAALVITTFAPTVTTTEHNVCTPTTAALSLTTFAPTVTASDHQTAVPTTASLVLTTFAPTVTSTGNNVCTPTTAALVLTTFAPTVTATEHNVCTPTTAALVITGYAPTVTAGGSYVEPTTAALVLTTYAPTVSTSSPVPIISYGEWDTAVTLIAGEEWMVTLDGPSCDAPKARVTVRFRWST